MRNRLRHLGPCLLLLVISCSPEGGPPQAAGNAVCFEGARLIAGDGGAPIENSAFLVEDDAFAWVGRQGEMDPPDGAVRVDLNGKTVIPALIDAHQHLGLTNVKDGTSRKENYTRENLIEHLERSAYHGVAATMSLGLEHDETLALQLRDEVIPNAARFLTSGRGIAGTPMAGPQQEYRLGIERRDAAGPPRPDDQFQLQCRNLARNHDAGMVIGMGTDSGTSVAWTTHAELRDMVTCGLSPMEAIVAATRVNAAILGLDQLGTVATGKSASFVVLDADPLEDINNNPPDFSRVSLG